MLPIAACRDENITSRRLVLCAMEAQSCVPQVYAVMYKCLDCSNYDSNNPPVPIDVQALGKHKYVVDGQAELVSKKASNRHTAYQRSSARAGLWTSALAERLLMILIPMTVHMLIESATAG